MFTKNILLASRSADWKTTAELRRGDYLHFSNKVPVGFWKDRNNSRLFFDRLKTKLNINDWEGWYHVTKKDITKYGGSGLLRSFGNSPMKAIMSNMNEYPWVKWKFDKVYNLWAADIHNQRLLFYNIAKNLQLKHWTDWYRVTKLQIIENGGHSLLVTCYKGSPMKAIMTILSSISLAKMGI